MTSTIIRRSTLVTTPEGDISTLLADRFGLASPQRWATPPGDRPAPISITYLCPTPPSLPWWIHHFGGEEFVSALTGEAAVAISENLQATVRAVGAFAAATA
jgi:hypothetical protein